MDPAPTTASTDFCNVSHALPAAELSVAFVPVGTAGHSKEYCQAAGSEPGHLAALVGAKAMGAVGYDLITQPGFAQSVKGEFNSRK